MTHFAVVVLVDDAVTRDTAEDAVRPLLAPYDENGEWFAEGSRWDWWVVGGRWTGCLGDYNPREDIANYEVCEQCNGTGERPDGLTRFGPEWVEWCNGCNGCHGNGMRVAFRYQPHEGDVVPAREVDFTPAAIVTPDGRWHEQARNGWFGAVVEDEDGEGPKPEALWEATVKALYEQAPDATAVLVDCHV